MAFERELAANCSSTSSLRQDAADVSVTAGAALTCAGVIEHIRERPQVAGMNGLKHRTLRHLQAAANDLRRAVSAGVGRLAFHRRDSKAGSLAE
jgi:hypothetical protein